MKMIDDWWEKIDDRWLMIDEDGQLALLFLRTLSSRFITAWFSRSLTTCQFYWWIMVVEGKGCSSMADCLKVAEVSWSTWYIYLVTIVWRWTRFKIEHRGNETTWFFCLVLPIVWSTYELDAMSMNAKVTAQDSNPQPLANHGFRSLAITPLRCCVWTRSSGVFI